MKRVLMAVTAVAGLWGCSLAMAQDPVVAAGKEVRFDYTLTVNNEQIETSIGKEPLSFVVGDGAIIPGLEKQILGMHVNEEKIVTVAPKEAYGEVDPKALKEFPVAQLPKGATPKVGMVLQATAPDGSSFPATIHELKADKMVLDFNHPLAGKTLTFKVKVVAIMDAPKEGRKAKAPAMPAAKPAVTTSASPQK